MLCVCWSVRSLQSHPRCVVLFSDSETNLKVKQALTVTGEMGDGIEALAGFAGRSSQILRLANWFCSKGLFCFSYCTRITGISLLLFSIRNRKISVISALHYPLLNLSIKYCMR